MITRVNQADKGRGEDYLNEAVKPRVHFVHNYTRGGEEGGSASEITFRNFVKKQTQSRLIYKLKTPTTKVAPFLIRPRSRGEFNKNKFSICFGNAATKAAGKSIENRLNSFDPRRESSLQYVLLLF